MPGVACVATSSDDDQVDTEMTATHHHISAAVAAESDRRGWASSALRVADVGCGDGSLIEFLHARRPNWELHGYDIVDYIGGGPKDFPASTIDRLRSRIPDVDWHHRIRLGCDAEPWPYGDASIDVVITNQVIEHIADLSGFLAEMRRVMAPGGFAVNIFPLRNRIKEGHIHVPLSAHVRGQDQRDELVRAAHRIGVGKQSHRNKPGGATEASEYIAFSTYYRSFLEIARACKPLGLRCAYRYSSGIYRQKARGLIRRPTIASYKQSSNALLEFLSFSIYKWLSAVTIVLERPSPGTRFVEHGSRRHPPG